MSCATASPSPTKPKRKQKRARPLCRRFLTHCRCHKIRYPDLMKNKFTAVINKDSDWWIGWVEGIPGVNSQGKTKAELLKNLHSALTEALKFNREDARKAAQDNYEEAFILV